MSNDSHKDVGLVSDDLPLVGFQTFRQEILFLGLWQIRIREDRFFATCRQPREIDNTDAVIFGQRSDQAEKLGRKKQHFGRVGRGVKWFLKPPCFKSVNVKFNGKVNCYLKPPVNFIFYIIMEVNWHLKPQYKF